ncbi:MAG: phytanoyl-CoA dioxygenase family protein [Gammaproteobacteria bacterium]|nr:phytanoyl-CoA dioxygenase family protein [Gammaproteobacteria bacterium]
MLDAAQSFLAPYSERIQLHLTQTIFIGPGEGAQMFHRDRQAWGKHIPDAMEPQFNTIWALSDFTAENGATRVVPGSHRWERGRQPEEYEVCQAVMKRGSVLLYSGSVIHSGGENRTDEVRRDSNITYSLGWLRQEENQFLSCPHRDRARFAPGSAGAPRLYNGQLRTRLLL